MIGCWGFREVPSRYGPQLRSLPTPPAYEYVAFLLYVRSESEFASAIEWVRELNLVRPGTPLGIVAGRSPAAREAILDAAYPWTVALRPETYPGDFPPDALLEPLLRVTIDHLILAAWEERYGDAGPARSFLLALAREASFGHNAGGVARRFGLSRSQLYRRVAATVADYPAPGILLRQGRVLAHDLRVARGMGRQDALRLGGWYSTEALRKAIRRLGAQRIQVDP